MPDLITAARDKLAEIAAEKSLPEDAVTLFGQLIDQASATAETVASFNELDEDVDGLSSRVNALESRAAEPQVAAGIAGAPLVAAAALIAAGRANGAISGVTAEAFDHVLAALGYAPQPPANETPAPDGGGAQPPTETSTETPAESTGGTDGSTETPAAEGDAQPNPAEAGG